MHIYNLPTIRSQTHSSSRCQQQTFHLYNIVCCIFSACPLADFEWRTLDLYLLDDTDPSHLDFFLCSALILKQKRWFFTPPTGF
jgi:hypothetical protein